MGLVIPHLLRLLIGPDHRVLVPACVLGGGAYMVFCDLLARVISTTGGDARRCDYRLNRSPPVYFSFKEVQTVNKAIEIKNLMYAYGNQRILDNLSFGIQRGDFFIIIGPNGSGKTTLMKIISGITKLQQGEVTLLDQSLQRYTQRTLAKKIAYVPQMLPPDFPFTVAQLVLMGRAPYHGLLGVEQEKDFEIAKKSHDVYRG